ncbi:MAG: hypothetical protein ACSW8G_03320 [Bacillota bacterium]
MNIEDALRTIDDNKNASNDSFLFFLHERNMFSEEAFRDLCEAIDSLEEEPALDTKLIVDVSEIYQFALFSLMCHFDPNDSYCIEKLPADYADCAEELRAAVESFYHRFSK